jgi:hypothetical protein
MTIRWSASARQEKYKLSNKEDDWNLNGKSSGVLSTRTWHGGNGRPNFVRTIMLEDSSESEKEMYRSERVEQFTESEDSEWGSSDASEDFTEDDDEEEERKPPASRVILEVESLKTMMEKSCRCIECDGPVEVVFRTVCVATSVILYCKSRKCGFTFFNPPSKVAIEIPDNRERSTDYGINSLYVLGFLSCGDGCTEAARLLGILGLPNDTTMESRSFTIIESRLSKPIQEVMKQVLTDNLIEEVRMTMERSSLEDNRDFLLWKQCLNNTDEDSITLAKSRYPRLTCSFDMGWQQRSSGQC